MRATKMTSSHCRSVTPPLSRSSSVDSSRAMPPEVMRHKAFTSDPTRSRALSPDFRNLSTDLSIDLSRHRPLSPVFGRCVSVSSDLVRRSRSPGRARSLMESLLVAKMEALSTGKLIRTDSMDSCSSFGSMTSLPSDVCRCDDCLLGIVDFYMPSPSQEQANKSKTVCVFFLYVLL